MRNTRYIYITFSFLLCVGLIVSTFQTSKMKANAESDQKSDVSDEDFFGKWDSDSSSWEVEGQIDYDYSEDLTPVEKKVKDGDYNKSKEHLLSYYKNREKPEELSFTKSERNKRHVTLLKDNIFTLGKGEHYIETFDLENDISTVNLDVSDKVSDSKVSFFLMARNNESSTGQFHSKEADEGQPLLEVKVDGETETFKPTNDFYIRAGSYKDTEFGKDAELEVRDDGPGAFTEETRKSYLTFDLSSLSSEPSEATLKLTGKNATGNGEKKIMLFNIDQTDLDEEEQNWNNTKQDTYSWEGQEEGYDWKTPEGADSEFGYQVPRFYSAAPLAYEYQETNDESNAQALIHLMMDFIKDADSYDSPMDLGAGSYPRSLDTAERVENWLQAYDILKDSESLEPSNNMDILKTIYKSGEFLETKNTEGNWGVAENSGLYHIAVYFPEFNKSSEWFDNANETLKDHLQESLHDDGSYIETTVSYASGVANDYLDITEFATLNDRTFEGEEQLSKLGHYLMDVSLPNGDDPGFGDSSGLNLRSTIKDLGDVLDDPELLYVGTGGDKGNIPSHTSSIYPDDSTVVMRSGWHDQDLYARLGVDDGGHNHPDENELIIYGYGKKLIPSTGTKDYNDESEDGDPISEWLRESTESHNTVQINDQDQDSSLPGSIDHLVDNDQFNYTEGVTESTPGFTHKRNVMFVNQEFWIVSDLIDAPEGENKYAQNWHFLPDANIDIDSNAKTTQTNFKNDANIQVVPSEPDKLEASVEDGYYSPEFYKVSKAKYGSYVQNVEGDAKFNTVLYPTEAEENDQVEVSPIDTDSNAEALEINRKEDAKGLYYLSHESSPEENEFADYSFDGKLAYIENDNENKSIFMHNGSTLKKDDKNLIESNINIEDIGIKNEKETLEITGDDLEPNQNMNSSIAIYVPSATNVELNGENIDFDKQGDYIYAVGVESSNKLKEIVDQYEEDGEIDEEASHRLNMHLTAINHYEDEGKTDKVIKHFDGFEVLLTHEKDSDALSNKAYEALKDTTDSIVDRWQE